MHNDNSKVTAEDRRDRDEMLRLYWERGSMTADQLVAAGISKDSQSRNTPWVAEQIKLREAA